jgi:alkylation response protein AidB-like acyl-CoA dehydrogenase
VFVEVHSTSELEPVAAKACWSAWNASTLSFFAGIARRALELAVEHARTREQFGAPLAALPAIQSRLADAALASDAITLLAWVAASNDGGIQAPELRWAGAACCEVTAGAQQVHGALGFALETGLHVFYRRARAVHAWSVAVCDAQR